MFRKFFYISLIIIVLCAFDEPRLSRKSPLKGVSMLVPTEFIVMPDAEIAMRSPSYRKPVAVYSDRNYESTLTINVGNTEWAYKDLKMLQKFYKANFQNLFVNLEFKQDAIKQIGKYQFVVFEFTGVVNSESKMLKRGQAVYGYILYTVSEGNILIFNFNCPYRLKEQWKTSVKKMMESIQIAAEPDIAR